MLTKMYLTNFLSFTERTEFDFTASKYTILEKTNVYKNDKNEVLKGALIIGPNASGKSNALQGISFLIKMVKGEGDTISKYRCFFAQQPVRKTEVEYEFIFDNKTVIYVIEYDYNEKKLIEKLEIDGETVLQRTGNKGELSLGQNTIIDDQLDPDTLFLRTASFNTGRFPQEPTLRQLMEYLNNSYTIDGYNLGAAYGISIMKYAEINGVDRINKYLEALGYDFLVEYGSESEGEGIKATTESEKKVVFLKRKSFPVPSAITMESQGNQVLANLLPSLIQVIEAPGMLIIDEFGNSLHNKLAETVIRFFMEHAVNSQLFITSHHTNLISNSVFRPDQVNLVTFEGKKGSVVKRLSKFKPREAQNLEKMYLGGMFEGLPVYEKLQD